MKNLDDPGRATPESRPIRSQRSSPVGESRVETPESVKDYYRRVTEVDIATIAKELLGERVTSESEHLLHCDCPRHTSQSHRSLHILLDSQGWHCFGCGVGGDVLQLVEFIQSGQCTRGVSGPMPESHRAARDFLAEKVGLLPLSKMGSSPEEIAKAEAARVQELRVHAVLTALASYYHDRLKAAPEVLEWLRSQYAISDDMIDELKIGYAANGSWVDAGGTERSGVVQILAACPEVFGPADLLACGAFRRTSRGSPGPVLQERIIFPYWSRGHVVYLIGRHTRWTPDRPWEQSKYKKLPTFDPMKRPYVATCIRNDHLYNEDVLLRRPERLVITEGVTDCIALMQQGFPSVSPVTVRIRAGDWPRLITKLSGVKTVFVSQDNEVSQVGLDGALQTARLLAECGIESRLVLLPLGKKQEEARQQLVERFGLDGKVNGEDRKKRLERLSEAEVGAVNRLLADAKIDVNEYFAGGGTAEAFEALLAEARTPLQQAISELPTTGADVERDRALDSILQEVAGLDPLGQDRHLKLIQARRGANTLSMSTLRQHIKAIQKENARREREQQRRPTRGATAPAGSCRAAIEQVLIETEKTTGAPDHSRAAEAAYGWFKDHGARFFRTPQGEPFMFFEDQLFWMDTGDRGPRRLYESTIYEHTGLVPTTSSARTFYAVLCDLAARHGEIRTHLSWLHTEVAKHTVYFNLNNRENEIAKISPDGVEILVNGGNADGIILAGSAKMAPIHFLPEADPEEADGRIRDLIVANLTCSTDAGVLILAWASCFLLLEFAGTRPAMRFEGSSGSGKTAASKLISAFVYGEAQHKKATIAANYADGSRNPLIVLDNIETKQMTDDLQAFMLTCVTGIANEKRKGGTDSETVTERVTCLLNTNGVEPLGGEFSEVLSRSFIIPFALDDRASNCFLESKVLAGVRAHRDLMLSVLLKRTSQVLGLIRDGAQERVMRLLHASLGNHNKSRANDYISLMYLMSLAGEPLGVIEQHLGQLHPSFLARIKILNEVTMETARESNPIATVLAVLFKAHRLAVGVDERNVLSGLSKTSEDGFVERYQLEFEGRNVIRGALARELFTALQRCARDFGLSFPLRSAQQFAQRFANDLGTIREAGFQIVVNELPKRKRTYDLTLLASVPETGERVPFTTAEPFTPQPVARQ